DKLFDYSTAASDRPNDDLEVLINDRQQPRWIGGKQLRQMGEVAEGGEDSRGLAHGCSFGGGVDRPGGKPLAGPPQRLELREIAREQKGLCAARMVHASRSTCQRMTGASGRARALSVWAKNYPFG